MTREEYSAIEAKIGAGQSELLGLAAKMRASDAHACKCAKLGLVFADEYPEEYAEYEQARAAYNETEESIAGLKAELAAAVIEEEELSSTEE